MTRHPIREPTRQPLAGFSLWCPVCLRPILPEVGLLHLALAPRWTYHVIDRHPYEAAILRLHLNRPPTEWPVIDDGAA